MEKRLISARYFYDKKIPFFYTENQKRKIKEFEEKVSLKNNALDECYICKHKEFIQISQKDKYGFYYPVVICKECGLVQTNPYYSTEEVSLFYSEYFREIYMGTKQTQKYIFNNNIKRGTKIISFIEEKMSSQLTGKKVLDIGCGNGGILKAFNNQQNECLGIDLGSTYFNEGLKNNLDLRQTSLKDLLESEKELQFDVIIFSHNLEHLINPLEELELLKDIIHEDTIVFISVPGIYFMDNDNYDYLNEFFQNAHKSHFCLNSLNNLMKTCNFELIYGDEEIKTIFKLQKKEQTLLLENYEEVFKKIKETEEKYSRNLPKLIFIKTIYFILDKFGLRITFLKFLNKIKLTHFLRKILLNEK